MGNRAEIKVRMGTTLLAAVRARAADQGLSVNSFVVQVLASTVGTAAFDAARQPDPSDAPAPPDTGWLEPVPDLGYLRSAYQNAHWGTIDPIELFLTTDEQVLEWAQAGTPRPDPLPLALPDPHPHPHRSEPA